MEEITALFFWVAGDFQGDKWRELTEAACVAFGVLGSSGVADDVGQD